MQIPAEAIVPREKLTRYLLAPRSWDDKSQYLAQAGFSDADPLALERAIRRLVAGSEAVEDGNNEYGTFYRVAGPLVGPNGLTLQVVLIWLQWKLDGSFHFVTLKPHRV